MLSDKVKTAENSNITISFSGLIPSDAINPVDLCIIFGNMIDNAIEACEKISVEKNKIINISAKQQQDYMFITITNPVVENIKIKNNIIPSTKDDKKMHGIGIYSVKQILDKHYGHFKLECIDRTFTVYIDFRII